MHRRARAVGSVGLAAYLAGARLLACTAFEGGDVAPAPSPDAGGAALEDAAPPGLAADAAPVGDASPVDGGSPLCAGGDELVLCDDFEAAAAGRGRRDLRSSFGQPPTVFAEGPARFLRTQAAQVGGSLPSSSLYAPLPVGVHAYAYRAKVRVEPGAGVAVLVSFDFLSAQRPTQVFAWHDGRDVIALVQRVCPDGAVDCSHVLAVATGLPLAAGGWHAFGLRVDVTRQRLVLEVDAEQRDVAFPAPVEDVPATSTASGVYALLPRQDAGASPWTVDLDDVVVTATP